MDICSHIGFPANDINSLHGICLDPLGSTYGVVGDFSVDELAYEATKFLNIQDNEDGVLGSIPPYEKGVFQMKDKWGEAHQSEIITKDHNAKSINPDDIITSEVLTHDDDDDDDAKSINPDNVKSINPDDIITSEVLTHDDDNAKSINPPCSSAPSLPKPLKLVSAMKGSREKGGVGLPPKLSVKWAPDVYDPVPTSVVSNRGGGRKHSGKKKSKKKGSRESKGKEKKQSRKRGSGSGSCLNYYSEQKEEEVFASAMDFHLDYFCGSNFANRYGSSLQIAEAT